MLSCPRTLPTGVSSRACRPKSPTGEAWLHKIKHDGFRSSPELKQRPTSRPAAVLFFARWCEHPESLRGTIEHALFLPSARSNLWGTPNSPGLRRVRAVRLNAIRDVALEVIGSDSGVLGYRGRSKHRGGRDNG